MYNIIKKSLLTLSLISLPFVFASSVSATAANSVDSTTLHAITASLAMGATSKPKPTATALKASVTSLSAAGGTVTVSSKVNNAVSCKFSVAPTKNIKISSKTQMCSKGTYKFQVNLPKVVTTKAVVYTFNLTVTGKYGIVKAKSLKVKVNGVIPLISKFVSTQNVLPNSGGSVTLSGSVTNATSCTISVSPAISGFGGAISCSNGSFSSPVVTLPANITANAKEYTFSITATNINGHKTVTDLVYVKGTDQLTGINVVSNKDMSAPIAIVSDGSHIWTTNYGNNSITEINQNNGDIIATLNASEYKFFTPVALVAQGSDLWVANYAGNSITEINTSTGALVRVINAASYKLNYPSSLAVFGSDLWVANNGNGTNGTDSITEINTSTGALVRVINNSSGPFAFNEPCALVFDGTNLWVANYLGNSITEINTSTGALVRVINNSSGPFAFNEPNSLVFDGTNIWTTNYGNNSITETNASTGAYESTLSGSNYDFDGPNSLVFDGTNLWVANLGTYSGEESYVGGDSITEINASTGAYESTLSGSNYDFDGTISLYFDGTNLWVANYLGNSITEISL